MRIYLLAFFAVLFSASSASATDWYVDGQGGNDKHAGTSSSTAFLTPAKATSVVQPGDTIHFLPTAVYTQIALMKSGTASAPITLQGDGVSPNLTEVTGNGANFGIQINQGASYVVVKNFDVQAPGAWNSIYVGSGSTHVTVTGNVTHNAGHCGINATHADYLTLTYNVVYDTSNYTGDGIFCSGISTYEDNNSDSNTGVKNIISGNVVYANTNVPTGNETDSDGSGIILDDLRHTQSDNAVYNGKTLIENNLIFDNGGRGIYIYLSDHAIVTNNTVYFNNQDPHEGSYNPGEIGVEGGGGDIQIYNNIAYSDGLAMSSTSTHMAMSVEDATDGVGTVTADYNLLYNTQGNAGNMYYAGTTTAHTNTNTVTFGSHNLWLNPQFVAPGINPSTENFLLQNTSPGRGTAYVTMAAATDITGAARPSTNVDMGAYQQTSVPVCGTSNNIVLTAAPTANLCAVGAASSVTGTGPWSWTCTNSGTTASCQALVPTLSISVIASADNNQGAPTMALYVNGILEGSTSVTAVHSSNQWQTFIYNMQAPTSLQSITVAYMSATNGSNVSGRNLYVQSVTVNSTTTLLPQQGIYTDWGTSQTGSTMMWTPGTLTWSNTPLAGKCGASNGVTVGAAPTANLCGVGTASAVAGSGPWTWTCTGLNGGGNASCSAPTSGGSTPTPVNGTCGASNTATLNSVPTSGLCGVGSASSVTGSGPWAWTCPGSNGGTNASCSANLAVSAPSPTNGTCGASNTATLSSAPTSGLCGVGSASSVTGSGPWAWTCSGSNGGTNASCSANLAVSAPTPTNGSCGASNGLTVSTKPTANLCTTGTSSVVTGFGPWAWICAGANGGSTASCSASVVPPVNASCGASNGATLTNAPGSGLCGTGTASSVSGSGPWTWTCAGSNGGTNTSCSASLQVVQQPSPPPVDGACGSANGYGKVAPMINLCSSGTASAIGGKNPWVWTCAGSNGGVTAFCSAVMTQSLPVDGACGPANGVAVNNAPVVNLCGAGVSTTVRGSGPWVWDCSGSYNGATVSCSAPALSQQQQPTLVNGTCGASNGATLSSAPASGLCGTGSASSVTGSGPWGWTCSGSNGGSMASCAASLAAPTPVNGSCGGSNGTTLSSAPTGSLCNVGSASSVTGSGPWGWTCSGSNGGSTASCAASLAAPTPVNGNCGASNGATLSNAPTSGLCGTGNASSVSGSGPWSWSCSGANGGSTASCSANLQVVQQQQSESVTPLPQAVDGACGPTAGTTSIKTPVNGLCNSGTATGLVLSYKVWYWTCPGTNGGADASCTAAQ